MIDEVILNFLLLSYFLAEGVGRERGGSCGARIAQGGLGRSLYEMNQIDGGQRWEG